MDSSGVTRWAGVDRTAQILDVSRSTVLRMIRRDEIPHRRFGRQIRIPLSAIDPVLIGTEAGQQRGGVAS